MQSVETDYPGPYCIDAAALEWRSLRQSSAGEAIYGEGGRSCLLQEWLLAQSATVAMLKTSLNKAEEGVRQLGFFCEDGKYCSVAACLLLRELFAPTAFVYSYREHAFI